ncbi:MAG: hypothetical protein HWD91_03005 [Marivivens sp.]|nr:hypothetical protein [Marivivens sp.]NVJ94534.1 hypothetical protein [Marivivens sp.]
MTLAVHINLDGFIRAAHLTIPNNLTLFVHIEPKVRYGPQRKSIRATS